MTEFVNISGKPLKVLLFSFYCVYSDLIEQIIDIGEDDENLNVEASANVFELQQNNLAEIFAKLPSKDMKVSVISIVGAFRTGKSFMLNFFLRYLRYLVENKGLDNDDGSESWLTSEGMDFNTSSL